MKTTNRLISLFAAILTTATLMADVVYEHLEVDSGFNRDVIAEQGPSTQYAKSYLIADTTKNHWSMATQSVIRTVNTNSGLFTGDYAYEIETTAASGWPDDLTGDPANRIIHVEESITLENPLYAPVTWQLAAYDQKNVLTIRPVGGTTIYDPSGYSPGIQNGEGSLKFKKVGCYDKVFFLIAAAKENGAKDPREVKTIVHYSDGDTTQAKFTFGGLSGKVGNNVRRINIYESQYKKNTHLDHNNAYAMVFDMPVDPTKLISKIEFKNELVGTAVMIFAVTGRTADMEIPEEESMTVSDIDKTEFRACWDAIEDAASYRIDVAEDIDFQRILEDYNNLPVTGSTCQDIVNLVSNTDYYWRVRAVDSVGGQSASSAPHRVKTAADPDKGETPPYTDETYDNIEAMLAPYIGTKSTLAELDIHRTLYRDGAFNTLCLPFDLDAEQIDKSPLKGVQVYEFVHAEKNPVSNHLEIEISGPIDHITAGVPYLVKWAPTTPEVIDGGILVFKNVNVVTNHGQTLGGEDEVKFVGNIGIAHLVEEEQLGLDHNKLFLGAENTLYWPQDNTNLKGFRAYFLVPNDGPSGAPKNTPARIIERHETATGMEQMTNDKLPITQKIIRDNQIYILHNGTMYNVQGQEVKR